MATVTGSDRFLDQVEEGLGSALAEGPATGEAADGAILREAVRRLCLAPGAKRVRPRLVAHFGEALGVPPAGLVDVAVAAELIHAGSLLHDDVVDHARLRRGRPTANAEWGNLVAVLSGDLCLTL